MQQARVAIRVDATANIGTGHFMRCLTLADELKGHGAQIRFISRDLPPHLRNMLEAKNMEFAALTIGDSQQNADELAHSAWLGTSQSLDAQATLDALADHTWDWVIVDHYALDARWESAVRKCIKQIMVIDDIADRQHDCDVLLDQNFYADMETRYFDKVPTHCLQLLGPRYALLRDEFKQLRAQQKPRTGEVKKILIFFGGVDADNYTGLAIEALRGLDATALHVDVVIGAQHPDREAIMQACVTHGFSCHVQTTRMAELMAEADLAIGAGGTATWERCCLGLPTIAFCVAENQRKQIADAAVAGLLYAPASNDEFVTVVRRHTQALLENQSLLKCISKTAMKAIDGKGISRAIGKMGVSGIEIRLANEDDSRNLFAWRNHPDIRAVSNNNVPIEWVDHQRWLASVMSDSHRELLIGSISNKPLGVVRFDIKDDAAEISIYLIPGGGFNGQGRHLLSRAEKWLKDRRPEVKYIHATALGQNFVSQQFFIGAGYRAQKIHYLKEL